MILSDGFYNNATFRDYGVESRSVYVTLRFFSRPPTSSATFGSSCEQKPGPADALLDVNTA